MESLKSNSRVNQIRLARPVFRETWRARGMLANPGLENGVVDSSARVQKVPTPDSPGGSGCWNSYLLLAMVVHACNLSRDRSCELENGLGSIRPRLRNKERKKKKMKGGRVCGETSQSSVCCTSLWKSWAWRHTPIIPGLGKQRQGIAGFLGQLV